MADTFDAGKFGAVIAIPFIFSNATTGMTNSDLTFGGGAGTLFTAPAAGSVVGISARSNTALTAGSVTLLTHAAGTEHTDSGAPSAVVDATNQGSYGTVRPGAVTFAAGGTLGLSLTTTTTLDPTDSADVDAVLFVQLNAS